MRVTYVGHATLLLELGGRTLLTDPNFDPALGPLALGDRLRRVCPPGIALDALPPIDAVLVTHAHVDHLSLGSLRTIVARGRPGGGAPPVVAPPGVARWLRAAGFDSAAPLAAGAALPLDGVTVHAAAATHVGSRWGVDRWRAEASMYLLDAPERTAFFAGDTALTPTTHALAERVVHAAGRALDLALLPIGHAPDWKLARFRAGHLTTEDALELFERLRARCLVPYHWGTFNHMTSGAHDAIRRLRAALPGHRHESAVRILEPGQTLAL